LFYHNNPSFLTEQRKTDNAKAPPVFLVKGSGKTEAQQGKRAVHV
jgi:hypothetical protein